MSSSCCSRKIGKPRSSSDGQPEKLQWGFTIQGSAFPDAGSCSFLAKLQIDASISDAESHKRTFDI
jgi:hypothetical protein